MSSAVRSSGCTVNARSRVKATGIAAAKMSRTKLERALRSLIHSERMASVTAGSVLLR